MSTMNEEKNWIISEDDLLEDPTKILDSPWLNMDSYDFITIFVPVLPAASGFYCIKATFTKNYPSDPPILMALTPIDSYEPFEIVPLDKFGIYKWDPTITWEELWKSVDKTLSSSGNQRLNDVYLDLLLEYLIEYNLIIFIKNSGDKLLEAVLDSLAPSTIEDLIKFRSLLEATELTLTSDQVNENEKEVQKNFMFTHIVGYKQKMATSKVKITTSHCKENMHNCWYFLVIGPEHSCYNDKLFFGHVLFSNIDLMQSEHFDILSPFLRRINSPKVTSSNKFSDDFIILYQYITIRCTWEQNWAYFMSNKSPPEYNAIEDKENIELDYEFSVKTFEKIIKNGNLGKVFKQLTKTLEFHKDDLSEKIGENIKKCLQIVNQIESMQSTNIFTVINAWSPFDNIARFFRCLVEYFATFIQRVLSVRQDSISIDHIERCIAISSENDTKLWYFALAESSDTIYSGRIFCGMIKFDEKIDPTVIFFSPKLLIIEPKHGMISSVSKLLCSQWVTHFLQKIKLLLELNDMHKGDNSDAMMVQIIEESAYYEQDIQAYLNNVSSQENYDIDVTTISRKLYKIESSEILRALTVLQNKIQNKELEDKFVKLKQYIEQLEEIIRRNKIEEAQNRLREDFNAIIRDPNPNFAVINLEDIEVGDIFE
uniref:Uncharacterized protein n=1 Tax=Acrobeloides nanus TaxID=290746 RepID=A0A914EK93_9BILA